MTDDRAKAEARAREWLENVLGYTKEENIHSLADLILSVQEEASLRDTEVKRMVREVRDTFDFNEKDLMVRPISTVCDEILRRLGEE